MDYEKLSGGSLSPAYGRTYTKVDQIEKDFREGKDFVLHSTRGSGYCSIRDFEKGSFVQFRYGARLEKTTGVYV